jgi:hypothetical protein
MRVGSNETLTDERLAELEARARRNCPNDPGEGTFTTVHWLTLRTLPPPPDPVQLWDRLVQAGLLRVPPEPHANWHMLDGFTYVLEVRVGNTYRASILPQSDASADEADLIIREVTRILEGHVRSRP